MELTDRECPNVTVDDFSILRALLPKKKAHLMGRQKASLFHHLEVAEGG
jgi:hypothetical protein